MEKNLLILGFFIFAMGFMIGVFTGSNLKTLKGFL